MTWKKHTELPVNELSTACYVIAKSSQTVHVSAYTNNYLLRFFSFRYDMRHHILGGIQHIIKKSSRCKWQKSKLEWEEGAKNLVEIYLKNKNFATQIAEYIFFSFICDK